MHANGPVAPRHLHNQTKLRHIVACIREKSRTSVIGRSANPLLELLVICLNIAGFTRARNPTSVSGKAAPGHLPLLATLRSIAARTQEKSLTNAIGSGVDHASLNQVTFPSTGEFIPVRNLLNVIGQTVA